MGQPGDLRRRDDPGGVEDIAFDHGGAGEAAKLVAIATKRAATVHSPPDSYPTLVFVPEGDVTMTRLVAVLSAFAGPECGTKSLLDVDRTKCFFPLRIIQAEVERPAGH